MIDIPYDKQHELNPQLKPKLQKQLPVGWYYAGQDIELISLSSDDLTRQMWCNHVLPPHELPWVAYKDWAFSQIRKVYAEGTPS